MVETNLHHWVVGATRDLRETTMPALVGRRLIQVDCHRNIGGPLTGTSALVRELVRLAMDDCSELLQRHRLVLGAVAPELKEVLQTPETLTTEASAQERSRFFGEKRTMRVAHGVIDFLQALANTADFGPFAVLFENVHAADLLDQQFLQLLVRRARPELLQVIVSSAEPLEGRHLSEDLIKELRRFAVRVEAPGQELSVAEAEQQLAAMSQEERLLYGERYVRSDCTSDWLVERVAYEAAAQEVRARWHDQRAEQLVQEGVCELGAVPLHRERGSDPLGAGLRAIVEALGRCMNDGYYQAVIDLADRGRALAGPESEQSKVFWYCTLTKMKVLGAIGLTKEAEELCFAAQMISSEPEIHMQATYTLSMLYTRYKTERDHQMAKVWIQVALALASQMEDPKGRAYKTSFYKNGLALVELHAGNSEKALQLVVESYELVCQELLQDKYELHRSVVLYNRGQIYARLKRYEEAVEVYRQVIEIDPYHPEYHFDLGNLYNQMGEFELAIASYTRALEVGPPFPEVTYNRGVLLKQLNRVEEALADFSYLLELNEDDVEALEQRAHLYLENGGLELARRDAERGLQIEPQRVALLNIVGMIEMEEGKLEAAVSAFTSALSVDASSTDTWANRAVSRFELGDIVGAIADLTEALALGEDATVLFNRAWAYQANGEWEAAIRDYSAALHFSESDVVEIHYQRGCCYLQAGEQEAALADWREHLELAGSESSYREAIAERAPTLFL